MTIWLSKVLVCVIVTYADVDIVYMGKRFNVTIRKEEDKQDGE